MKIMRNTVKTFFFIFLFADLLIFGVVFYLDSTISKEYKVKGKNIPDFDTVIPITAEYNEAEYYETDNAAKSGESYALRLKVFGIIPFSNVNVEVVDELKVSVLGTPFGMKLYTQGVLVIDITDVATNSGIISPAKDAGIKRGDYIVSVDGKRVFTNEELSAAIEATAGNDAKIVINRNGKNKTLYLKAALSSDSGKYKIGLWVRDSAAGIGTLTFYSPATDTVCGLGHGVCDEDTEELMDIKSGEIVSAEIISVEKGSSGRPGQLNGRFSAENLGEIDANTESGLYSFLKSEINLSDKREIALKQEVKDGDAQILCTVEGDTPELYSCKIKKRGSKFYSQTQNLIITVTDKRLLEKTGGIVQGMSGSPILQNGKLVAAVTHVFVDDPKKGFCIYAENMLNQAKELSGCAKKAS